MSADAAPVGMSVHSQVTATGEAHVEQQIATQIVDSVVHNATIYTTLPGDSPARRLAVARAHLDGGNPRKAEEILGSLLVNGPITSECTYFYVLSVLSDHSFTDITTRLSDEIHNAMSMTVGLPMDEWRSALDVVDMLLRYAHAEFGDGTVAHEFAAALDVFGTLGADRQDEIDRHLDLILSGAVQEILTSERKHKVAVERMNGDRVGRAWKFFEANPLRPMKWLVPPARPEAADWRAAILGCVVAALAIARILDGPIAVDVVFGLMLIVAGGYLVWRCAAARQTHLRYAESMRANFEPQSDQ